MKWLGVLIGVLVATVYIAIGAAGGLPAGAMLYRDGAIFEENGHWYYKGRGETRFGSGWFPAISFVAIWMGLYFALIEKPFLWLKSKLCRTAPKPASEPPTEPGYVAGPAL